MCSHEYQGGNMALLLLLLLGLLQLLVLLRFPTPQPCFQKQQHHHQSSHQSTAQSPRLIYDIYIYIYIYDILTMAIACLAGSRAEHPDGQSSTIRLRTLQLKTCGEKRRHFVFVCERRWENKAGKDLLTLSQAGRASYRR